MNKDILNTFKDLPRFDSIVEDIVYSACSIGKPHSFYELDEDKRKLLVVAYFLQKISYLEKHEIFVETHGSEDFGHLLIAAATGIITADQFIAHVFKSASEYYGARIDDYISDKYVERLNDDDSMFDMRSCSHTYSTYEERRGL